MKAFLKILCALPLLLWAASCSPEQSVTQVVTEAMDSLVSDDIDGYLGHCNVSPGLSDFLHNYYFEVILPKNEKRGGMVSFSIVSTEEKKNEAYVEGIIGFGDGTSMRYPLKLVLTDNIWKIDFLR